MNNKYLLFQLLVTKRTIDYYKYSFAIKTHKYESFYLKLKIALRIYKLS